MRKKMAPALTSSSLPHGQDRSRLVVGDPDRSLATAWAVGGGFDLKDYYWTSPFGSMTVTPRVHLPRTSGNGWPLGFYGSARLPDGAKPGRWTLDCGRGGEFAFDVVVAPPPSRVTPLGAGATASAVTRALAKGSVLLGPGLYPWTEPVVLPASTGLTLTGPGAVVRSSATTVFVRDNSGNAVVQDLTIDGVAFDGPAGGAVFPWLPGLVVKGCEFRGGVNFGATHSDATVKDCLFEGAGMTYAPLGLVYHNCFRNAGGLAATPPHAYMLPYSSGRNVLIENVWDGTDRGMVFNTDWNDTADCLILGNAVVGCTREENGSEGLIAEGAGRFDRNLIFSNRYQGQGPALELAAPSDGCLLWNWQSDGPVLFWGQATNHTLIDSEVRGYVEFSPGAAGITLTRVGVHLPFPSRGNNTDGVTWVYDEPVRQYAARINPNAPGAGVPGQELNKWKDCRLYPGAGMLGVGPGLVTEGVAVDGHQVPDGVVIAVAAP